MYATCVAFLVSIGVFIRFYLNSVNGFYIITRIYDIVEYTLLSYFFSLHLKNNTIRLILVYSAIPFCIYCLYDFFIAKEPAFAFLPLVTECLVLLSVIIYIFYEKNQIVSKIPLNKSYFFWIAVAFMVYASGNFFLFLYSKNTYNANDETFKNYYTIIYSVITILKNILLCTGISLNSKNLGVDNNQIPSFGGGWDLPDRK